MVSEQSILEMKEISRNMSVGFNEILRLLRKVQSETSSMTDNLSLLKEELRIMKNEEMEDFEEDESYGDEDEDDKELGEELAREATSGNLFNNNEDSTTIALINSRDSKFIAKSDPIPSPDPYSCSIPNPDLYSCPIPNPDLYSCPISNPDLNPETALNSSSDQNSDLNFKFGNATEEEAIEEVHVNDEYDNQKRNFLENLKGEIVEEKSAAETIITCSRDETRILKFGFLMVPISGNCNAEIESVSCVFDSHPNPDIDPDPPDTYRKPFNMCSCSSISFTLHTNSIPSKLVSDHVIIDDERNQLDKMKKREKQTKAKVAIDFEWNFLLNCRHQVRNYDEKSLVIVVEVVQIPYSFYDNNDENDDRKAFGKEEVVVGSKLLFLAVPQQENSREIFIIKPASDQIQVAMTEAGMKLKSIIGLCKNKKLVENRKGEKKESLCSKCQYCAWFYEQAGDYVEVVQGKQVSLLFIVGFSTSERIMLEGVERIMPSDSGIHVDEVESNKCLAKVVEDSFPIELGNAKLNLVVEALLPIELGSADLNLGVQWLRSVDAINQKAQSLKIKISSKDVFLIKISTVRRGIFSFVPKLIQTIFMVNPIKSFIIWKVGWADVYRKFLTPISRYSSAKFSSSVPEHKPTSTRIETVGEPPPWLVPPPTTSNIHLIGLLAEARVAWFHCSLFENTKSGTTTKQKTPEIFLSTTTEQKAAEFGRSTNKRSQSHKKRVLILLSEFGPWHNSLSFHKVAEKKSQNLLDFSEFVGFFKSWLSYGCNGNGEKERQEVEFSLEFLEGFSGTQMMLREGLSNGWLEDVHQEPPPPPQPPPLLEVFDIKKLNRLFHFFPP